MMKKNSNSCLFLYLFLVSFLYFCLSCENDPIFAAIEDEVNLKKHSVQGLISGIVVVGDDVYAANPKYVFTKKIGDIGEWRQMETMLGMCTSLATDGSNLYAAFAENGVYRYQNGSWAQVGNSRNISKIVSGVSIIGVGEDNYVFKLEGSSFINMQDNTGANIKLDSTLRGGAGYYFGDASSVYSYKLGSVFKLQLSDVTNIRDICKGSDDKNVFILTTASVFYYDGSFRGGIKHTVSSPWSITYSKKNNLIVVGGSVGYKEIQLRQNSLDDAFIRRPGEPGSTTPSSCYNQYNNSIGKWLLRPILIIDHQDGYIMYAGVGGGNVKYTGLWGFYNPGQLEWNRE